MKNVVFFVIFFLMASRFFGAEVEILHLPPSHNMERADLYYVTPLDDLLAVLVLAPGCNGSGEGLVRSPVWQEFARQNNLGLVGLSFAAPEHSIKIGNEASWACSYYFASQGSGELLLKGLHQIYGKDLPLLLYGFSGGASFTSGFEEWKPERVLAWCAYTTGCWDIPHHNDSNPIGIIACGDADPRYGASLSYFKKGRAAGKPLIWVSLSKVAHQTSPQFEEWVREYFRTVLDGDKNLTHQIATAAPQTSENGPNGLWVDVDTKEEISSQSARLQPSVAGWLPSKNLFQSWKIIHDP